MNEDELALGHRIEKFYVWLKDSGKTQNTCRNTVNGAIQFMKYFGKNPKYSKAKGIYKTEMSTKDHKLLITEVQQIAKVSDLREQVFLESWLLGLRISDVALLEWKQFQDDEFLLRTHKEGVAAHIFVSPEFREILNKYVLTLDKTNRYLFQSGHANEHITAKHIDHLIRALAKRAGLTSTIHWHLGRKLAYRTGLELGIPNPVMKMFLGKANPMADQTYYEGMSLAEYADQLHKALKLFPVNGNGKVSKLEETMMALEKENATLKQRIELLQNHFREEMSKMNERLDWLEVKAKKPEIIKKWE
jgi:integrase